MKLAVKMAKDLPNEAGLPAEWPTLCHEIDDDAVVKAPYIKMTVEEHAAQKAKHQAEYDVYAQALEDADQAIADAKEAKKQGARDKMKALGLTEEDLKALGV